MNFIVFLKLNFIFLMAKTKFGIYKICIDIRHIH